MVMRIQEQVTGLRTSDQLAPLPAGSKCASVRHLDIDPLIISSSRSRFARQVKEFSTMKDAESDAGDIVPIQNREEEEEHLKTCLSQRASF